LRKDDELVKFSLRDKLILLAVALFLIFLSGWFLTHRGGEVGKAYTVTTQRSQEAAAAASESPTASENPAPGLLEGERININTAPASDLTRLPGIGEKRAEDIVAWRTEHGPFEKPEDILDVPGIGEATLKKIISYITV